MRSLYRNTERPYYHQGCWEGVPEPKVRYEEITVTVFNSDGDDFKINVSYYVADTIATVTGYDKLIGLSDAEYDIREAIKSGEHNIKQINFAG